MKKEKKVIAFEDSSCAYDLPETPAEFLKWWSDKFDLVPEEYRDKTMIECDTDQFYDSTSFGVEIYYYRPETDGEEAHRIKQEEELIKFVENQELCQLENLKNKYKV